MKIYQNLGERIDGILNDIKSNSEELLISHNLSSDGDKLKERLLKETFERLEKDKIITPDIVDRMIVSDKLVVHDMVSDAARVYILDYVLESLENNETRITVEEAQKKFPLLNGTIKTDREGYIGIMYIPITMHIDKEANQDIVIFASAIGDFNIAENEEASVFATGITYSDYNKDNVCSVWQEARP